MKGEVICPVVAVRAAIRIIIGGPAYRDEIFSLKLTVHVLKRMRDDIRVLQEDAAESPPIKVRALRKRQGVANARQRSWLSLARLLPGPRAWLSYGSKRPVTGGLWILPNREPLSPTRNET